ncbi:MAG: riboflavin synthase, partial [Acidimicrobiales bacterium]
MFTGIVEEVGRVRRREGGYFEIEADEVISDAKLGDSIAVDGCCLTVVELGPGWWAAEAVVETLGRTTLGRFQVGDLVNLERPLRLSDRLGGHVVQGHVDATGTVSVPAPSLRITTPTHLLRYVVE